MENRTYVPTLLETVLSVPAIINISYYKFPKNYIFPGEQHDFWEFVYVDRGEILVTAGKLEYVLKAGEMAFHSCNEFHSQRSLKGSTADIIVVSFICTSPFMDDFKEKILFLNQAEKQCLHNVVRESEISYEAFEKAPPLIHMQKKASAPFGSDQLLKMGLEQLLILIYRRGESIGVQERQYRPSELSSRTLTVERVKSYIESHYLERLTLTALADCGNISISHLKRIFKEETGDSVISYLARTRISEAKRLIHEGSYSFTQIAELTGFDNIYYFSRRFKELTGMTPSEYALSVRE